MNAAAPFGTDETKLVVPVGERALVAIGFPLLGALAGWLVKLAAGWVAGFPAAPFHALFKLVASIPEPYATGGSLAVGLLAGVALTVVAVRERVSLAVSRAAVTVRCGNGQAVRVERARVDAVFLDGKQLVLLGPDGAEHDRAALDLRPATVRSAFVEHGYPWHDSDPHRDEFRLWVPDLPGLPDGANALLAARAEALTERASGQADAIRAELRRLGVVVRDEKRRQYWRLVTLTLGGR